MSAEIQQSVLDNFSLATDPDVFELYCDCLSTMISHNVSLDYNTLVTHLYGWLTDIANVDAG